METTEWEVEETWNGKGSMKCKALTAIEAVARVITKQFNVDLQHIQEVSEQDFFGDANLTNCAFVKVWRTQDVVRGQRTPKRYFIAR